MIYSHSNTSLLTLYLSVGFRLMGLGLLKVVGTVGVVRVVRCTESSVVVVEKYCQVTDFKQFVFSKYNKKNEKNPEKRNKYVFIFLCFTLYLFDSVF